MSTSTSDSRKSRQANRTTRNAEMRKKEDKTVYEAAGIKNYSTFMDVLSIQKQKNDDIGRSEYLEPDSNCTPLFFDSVTRGGANKYTESQGMGLVFENFGGEGQYNVYAERTADGKLSKITIAFDYGSLPTGSKRCARVATKSGHLILADPLFLFSE